VTVSLRNTSGESLFLGVPGDASARLVLADEIVHVDGDLAPKEDQPDDAYVIGDGDDARAWPKSTWTATGGKTKENG